MNKTFLTTLKSLAFAASIIASGSMFVSCVEDIPDEKRFTFTGETIASHLEDNPEFSHFCTILTKAKLGKKSPSNMLKTLSTYGSYTCFAPTNEAIEAYLLEKSQEENSGITSPYLEDLKDSMATVIAKNHLIEAGYRTIDINGNSFPQQTMNFRSVSFSVDTIPNSGGIYKIVLDGQANITEKDIETENGYIQVIDKALNPSEKPLDDQLEMCKGFELFAKALKETGWGKKIAETEIDKNYDGTLKHAGLISKAEGEAPYPERWQQLHTILIESDDLLADPTKNHLGEPITTLEQLEKLAQKFYGDEKTGEYTDPANALNKYIAYHILDRKLEYKKAGPGGFIMENYEYGKFKSEVNLPTSFDRYDYFETMLPFSLVKVTRPKAGTPLQDDIVINYSQEDGTILDKVAEDGIDMSHYLNVIVQNPDSLNIDGFVTEAKNGTMFLIDKILVYNEEEMRSNVLNERMRWDVTSLFPELTNNTVRWGFKNANRKITYIPHNYCKRLEILSTTTNIFYLHPTEAVNLGGYANYQGDELLIDGQYDFKYRIPYVPDGRYEIRFGYSQSNLRGVIQIYLDDAICGIPVDLRNSAEAQARIGWFEEEGTANEIQEKDKAMRNKGFMKGPASCHLDLDNPTSTTGNMRYSSYCIRRIVGQFDLGKRYDKNGNPDGHWMRIKSVTKNATNEQFNQDYLEIVPIGVITDPNKPEDQY